MAIAKCAHVGCSCLSTPDSYYCSQSCEEMAKGNLKEDKDFCGCAHDGCDPVGTGDEPKAPEPAV